jgi:transcriptional regulator with XRE-family HTH domain
MNYGKALRIGRAIAGLEQGQLAKHAGLDPSHISLIESGARQPSVGAIAKLCRALRIPEPLFTMLAAEAADLKGVGDEEFGEIGTYLAKFLMRYGTAPKRKRRNRSDTS